MNDFDSRRSRVFGRLAAVVGGVVLMAGLATPAVAAIDPLYERPPTPPDWLVDWLDDLREAGGLTPDLAAARAEYQWESAVTGALDHAAEAGSGVERWRPLVELYFRPGDVSWALRIIRCESGGDPEAKNPRSSARGLFQHLKRYWPKRAPKAGFADRTVFDPEANVAVAAWLLYKGGGKSHWTCKA